MHGVVTPVMIDKWRPSIADVVWVGRRVYLKQVLQSFLSHLSSSLAFSFSRSFLLRAAPHYLNAWNRL